MATHKKNASQTNASVQTARLKQPVTVKDTDKQIVLAAIQDITQRLQTTTIGTEKEYANQINASANMELLTRAPTVTFTVKRTVDHVTQGLNLNITRVSNRNPTQSQSLNLECLNQEIAEITFTNIVQNLKFVDQGRWARTRGVPGTGQAERERGNTGEGRGIG